ncbi:MAG: LCP family protein [Oscillospiraceae bacterium]|nr:LCP family protein [Oscillospiraceae bacterium]
MHLVGANMNTIHGTPKPKRGRAQKVIATVLVLVLVATGGVYALVNSYIRPPDVLPYTGPVSVPEEGAFVDPGHIELPEVVPTPDEQDSEHVAADPNRPSGIYTMLVVGKDEGGRTDTMLLIAVDSLNGGVRAVSIPRDTLIDLSGRQQKINAVWPITRSMDRVMESVESLIGFRPDNYVTLDHAGFAALVNVLGGVYFDVPHNMRYSDPDQNLHIHVNRGWQHLDGETALGVVRWRGNNDGSGHGVGDFGRIQTQQAFLRAVAGELLQIRNITRIGELADIFTEYVNTDLPVNNMIWYATQLMGMDSEDLQFFTMPITQGAMLGGASYVILDLEEWLPMINSYFNPYPSPVREENVQVYTRVNGVIQSVGDGRALTPTAPQT